MLAGKRILLVEDEVLISALLEMVLAESQAIIVGPCSRVADALSLAQTEPLDGALLDMNLCGESALPVAEALGQRGIPLVIMSGYGPDELPRNIPNMAICMKPFVPDEALSLLAGLIQQREADADPPNGPAV